MTGLERMITKIVNAVDGRQRLQQAELEVPHLGAIEAEQLYLSRMDALDAEERHIRRQLTERRSAPRHSFAD